MKILRAIFFVTLATLFYLLIGVVLYNFAKAGDEEFPIRGLYFGDEDIVVYDNYPGTTVPIYDKPVKIFRDGRIHRPYPGTTVPDYDRPSRTIKR